MGKQLGRHDRAGIETDRAAREKIAPAHGDEVGRTRPGADEMHGHRGTSGDRQGAGDAAQRETRAEQPRIGTGGGQRRRFGQRADAGGGARPGRAGQDACLGSLEAGASTSVSGTPSRRPASLMAGSSRLEAPVARRRRRDSSASKWASAARSPPPRRPRRRRAGSRCPPSIMAFPRSIGSPASPGASRFMRADGCGAGDGKPQQLAAEPLPDAPAAPPPSPGSRHWPPAARRASARPPRPPSTPSSLPPPPMKTASGAARPASAAGAAPFDHAERQARRRRRRCGGCARPVRRRARRRRRAATGRASIHSIATEPEPAPTSHSSSPRRGASEDSVTARISRLVIWPSCSNSVVGAPGRERRRCARRVGPPPRRQAR